MTSVQFCLFHVQTNYFPFNPDIKGKLFKLIIIWQLMRSYCVQSYSIHKYFTLLHLFKWIKIAWNTTYIDCHLQVQQSKQSY